MSGDSNTRSWLPAIWLVFGGIAAWFAYRFRSHATAPDGAVVPMSNDSFYHARRMLDAAGDYGFYQYDVRMHLPEGSWVNWPWAYDYLAGQALRLARWINPGVDPIAFLGWIPVLWTFVNLALVIGIARELKLRVELIALAALAFALAAATQKLHGFAMLDHHFLELTFVLGTMFALMRWLNAPARRGAAIATGMVLGLAPAFHTSTFILQLVLLGTLLVLWLRQRTPPPATLRACAAALVATTALILLPSEPFWDGQFTMALLSWFHLYVALCTGIVLVLFAWRPYTPRQLAINGASAVALGVPLLGTLLLGGRFLGRSILLLDQIEEMQSPLTQLAAGDWLGIFTTHSVLFIAVPVLLAWFVIRVFREREPSALAFFVGGMLGLVLMSLQLRLVYFGYVVLILGALFALQQWTRERLPHAATLLLGLLMIGVSVQPALSNQLFGRNELGLSSDYAMTYPIFRSVAARCAEDPGLLIATTNDGHRVRYHSDCPVLANNFILTAQHEAKIAELLALLDLSPAEFLRATPDSTRYVLVRLRGLYVFANGNIGIPSMEAVAARNPSLFLSLALAPEPPPGFQLLAQLRVPDARNIPMVQLYRVTPVHD